MSLIAIADRARSSEMPARFVRGGVEFIVDRSMPSFVGYEWIDDHTVRIHPDAVEEMEQNLATESDFE